MPDIGYTVPKESFDLLTSHFDLLLKLASGIIGVEGIVIAFLFARLFAVTQASIEAHKDTNALLGTLKGMLEQLLNRRGT